MSGSDLGPLRRSCGTVGKSCNDGPQDLDLGCRRGVDSVGNQKAVAGDRAASFTPGPPLRQSPSWALGELEDIACPLGDGITAGSASQSSDGAAAVVVMSRARAEELGLTWLAEIGAHGVVAGPDSTLQSQPANAIKKALGREGISLDQLDVVEINEAFAAVALASTRELGIDPAIVNVNGGAIAVGHPIGMSGARITLHVALDLERRGAGYGVAALCGAGGQGDALVLRAG